MGTALIDSIFISSDVFLMNLSICLLMKYVYYSKVELKEDNIGMLMCIATMVAHKVYYDNEFTDLFDFFGEVTGLNTEELRLWEGQFLEGVNYRVIIDAAQYQYITAEIFLLGSEEYACDTIHA